MRHPMTVSFLSAVLGGVAAALVVALAHPFTAHTTIVKRPRAGSTALTSRVKVSSALTPRQIYERDAPGVVAIRATSSSSDSGSGIVLAGNGLILTNEHVVEGAARITVALDGESGHTRAATLIAADKPLDLALVKIDASGLTLHPLTLGESATTQIGDSAYAIGNPFGLNWTLTTGIVSALNRQIKAPDGATVSHVIQTDAALNPGNSGGPLIDSTGAVIGVNSQIISGSSSAGGQGGSSGVGFAISSDTVKAFVQRFGG